MSASLDRLYELLPAIHRMRDSEQGEPLRALLRVIAEQVDVVEENIGQLYRNWFIETCEDWAVPYIADLVGYRQIHEAGEPGDVRAEANRARNRVLIPRREVANTIRYRRRKGTLALLELLANDVAGWPARAVEFFKLLGWTQSGNHLHLDRARTVDVRCGSALELICTPFDQLAHSVDVRRINSALTPGRYNLPSVGLFVWRLKTYPVKQTQAYCLERVGPHCFTFSALGNDAPIFLKTEPETDATHIAEEFNLPVPIRRRLLHEQTDRLYGEGKSIQIWRGVNKGNVIEPEPIPADRIVAADLSGWEYVPRKGMVAVDPVLGRIAFPPAQASAKGTKGFKGVWVSYYYGFSADLGGGTYERVLLEPKNAVFYRVGSGSAFKTIGEALKSWRAEKKADAVIEIDDNRFYTEPVAIDFLPEHSSLQLRAAGGVRPVIRLLDWEASQADALVVTGARQSRFVLDGLLVTGRGVQLAGDLQRVTIRHSTLVPGWGLDAHCGASSPAEPSIEVFSPEVCLTIEHSIVGSIQVAPVGPATEDESKVDIGANEQESVLARCRGAAAGYRPDPIRVCISDSIVDALDCEGEAIGAPGCQFAHAHVTIRRSTVFGQTQVHAMDLGENSIFNGRITVARRQHGCVRFSYVMPGSRTPTRYNCQPETAEWEAKGAAQRDLESGKANATQDEITACDEAAQMAQVRVRPQFMSKRYGTPTYCKLTTSCADEIRRGADDESEMGVFHDLYQPQRETNLRVRLDEYIPAGSDVGLIFAS